MPRTSKRRQFLDQLELEVQKRLTQRSLRNMDDEDDSVEDRKDVVSLAILKEAESKRYLFRSSKYRKGPSLERFAMDLDSDEEPKEDET